MLTFRELLIKEIDFEGKKSDFNKAVWYGLESAASHWIRNFKNKHYQTWSRQAYGYEARSLKYEERKRRFKRAYSRIVGGWIPMPKPPMDLQWSGDLRNFVTTKSPSSYRLVRMRPRGQNFMAIRVPVNLGNIYKSRTHDEVTRVNANERQQLRRIMVNDAKKFLATLRK